MLLGALAGSKRTDRFGAALGDFVEVLVPRKMHGNEQRDGRIAAIAN